MSTYEGVDLVDVGLNADPPASANLTVPAAATAVALLLMGYSGAAINADSMTCSFATLSSPIVTENGSGLSSNNSVHSTGALSATGAQTATISWNGSGAGFLTELGALIAFYVNSESPSDAVRAEDSDVTQYGTSSATCSTTCASESADVVVGVTTAFGGIPATPSGCTSLGTATIGGNGIRAWQVNSPGSGTTTVTSGTEAYPSQYMVAFKSGTPPVPRIITPVAAISMR